MKNAQNKNRAVCFFFLFFSPITHPFFFFFYILFSQLGEQTFPMRFQVLALLLQTNLQTYAGRAYWKNDGQTATVFPFFFFFFFEILHFSSLLNYYFFFFSSWPIPLLEEARLLSKRFFGESVRCKNHQYLCSHFELKTGRPTRSAFSLALCNSHL